MIRRIVRIGRYVIAILIIIIGIGFVLFAEEVAEIVTQYDPQTIVLGGLIGIILVGLAVSSLFGSNSRCDTCNGTGWVSAHGGWVSAYDVDPCPDCGGTGRNR